MWSRWHRAAAVLGAILVLLSCAQTLSTKGVITGGVIPCSGLPNPNGPHYAAATVTVLQGQVTWQSRGQGNLASVFPTAVATQANVDTNGTYRFVLDPGQYVLVAGFPGGNAAPFTQVTLQPGDDLHVDIPNMCI